jgi:type I restriction enzyme, S subunit
MKPYPKYKDSGVEWIGEVPEGWKVKRLKYVAAINEKTLTEKTDKNYQFYYIDIGNVTLGKIAFPEEKTSFESAPSRARRLVEDGDTIISTVRTYLKAIANINVFDIDIVVSTGFAVVSPKSECEKKYISYLLTCEKIIEQVCSLSVGISYPAVNSSDIANIQVWYPVSKEEQTAIATFLDRKTAEIDSLIAKKERLIELYEEEKAAVINHAVTKGLDPDAKMKDSGIEWLGEIPEHWEMKKTRYLFEIKKRIIGEIGQDVLSITQKGIKIKDVKNMDGQISSDYSKYQIVNKGDFAMNHMDLLTGYVDISIYDGVTSADYRVFSLYEPNCIDRYFLFLFQLGYKRKIFYAFGQGAAHFGRWRFPTEEFRAFEWPVPPREEQAAIVQHTENKCSHIDAIISKFKRQIELLKEYRTALISEAVTGKIDLRNEI